MMDPQFIILGLASAVVSVTVTQSYLTVEFRKWLAPRSEFFGKLFTCSYCFGHWTAALLLAWYYPGRSWDWYLVAWLALTGCSAIFSGIIGKLYE